LSVTCFGLPPQGRVTAPLSGEDAIDEVPIDDDALATASDAELDAALAAFGALHGGEEP